MADFPQLTPDSVQIAGTEFQLVEQSDLVFANCTTISKRLSEQGKQVHVFPPGVDLDAFPFSSDPPSGPQGSKIETLKHPVIGYIGGLHRHVDFDLIVKMANARPEWSWVFVGPLQASTEKLEGCRNIHLEGAKPHDELANYLQRFDVCIVPYLRSAYTETVVPVKVNEYLAAGKPVVSTDLPTVTEFNERHKILITTKSTNDDFLKGIEQALQLPKDPETLSRRREVAALCDWNVQIEAMSKLIEQKLAGK